MWSFPTAQFPINNLHFILLILYILTSSLILCNFILPVSLSTFQFQIQKIPPEEPSANSNSSQVSNPSEPHRQESNPSKPNRVLPNPSGKRRKRNYSSENVSRRSDPTKVRPGGEENRLFYHWIPDMKKVWDEGKDVYWPWLNSFSPCSSLNVHFALENTFPPTALVSYPGSGNSWLRYLIEATTGIFTGSIFKDKSLVGAGLLGEFNHPINNGRTIVQKTHHDTPTGLHPPKFKSPAYQRRVEGMRKLSQLIFGYRGILLVRNPIDAIFSYWNYVHTKDHKAHAAVDLNFPEFVAGGVEKWAGLVQTWIKRSSDFLLVVYEDLVENPRRELIRILNFLHVPVDEARFSCALEFLEGPFRRKHSVQVGNVTEGGLIQIGQWEQLIQTVQRHVDDTNEVLRQHFLSPLPYTFENSRLGTNVS